MSKTTLTEFKEQQLYPALFNYIDTAFPEMNFKFRRGYWQSRFHIDGRSSSSIDQTFVHYKRKDLIKDNSGRAMSLIDFEMQRSGCSFYAAMERLAGVCGLKLPEEGEKKAELYKKYDDSRLRLEKMERTFRDELWSGSEDGNKVLDYLRGRGWKDEEIRHAGLGCASAEAAASLSTGNEKKAAPGGDYKLAIPFRRGGWISGFKFRLIKDAPGLPKYINSSGIEKNAGCFGEQLSGFEPFKDFWFRLHNGDTAEGMNAFVSSTYTVVMEGELDALHASAALHGVQGYQVVATAGGAMTAEQMIDALARGFRKFILFFDNDDKGTEFTMLSAMGLHAMREKILSRQMYYFETKLSMQAMSSLLVKDLHMPKDSVYLANLQFEKAERIQIFVAQFPAGVKDADEFLRNHSAAELLRLIQCAEPYAIWSAGRVIDDFAEEWFKSGDFLNLPEYPYVIRLRLFDELKPILDAVPEYDREKIYAKLRAEYLPADIEPFVREAYKIEEFVTLSPKKEDEKEEEADEKEE